MTSVEIYGKIFARAYGRAVDAHLFKVDYKLFEQLITNPNHPAYKWKQERLYLEGTATTCAYEGNDQVWLEFTEETENERLERELTTPKLDAVKWPDSVRS